MVVCSSGLLPCLPLQGRTQLEGHPLHSDPHRFLFSPYYWPSAIITNGILNTSPKEITRNKSCLPDPHCFMLFSTASNSVFILHSFQSSSSSSVAFQTPCVLSVLTGLSCLCHYSTAIQHISQSWPESHSPGPVCCLRHAHRSDTFSACFNTNLCLLFASFLVAN